MEYKKYQHVERFGNSSVKGITNGQCYIFPKIDGTNGSIFLKDDKIYAGSRRRELSIEDDNAGFMNTIVKDKRFIDFFNKYPNYRLYGEWLTKHTIGEYKEDAWRKFYVFDVLVDTGLKKTIFENGEEYVISVETYLSYEKYSKLMDEYGIDYIPALVKIVDPTEEQLIKMLEKNTYLMKEGNVGEGIVIKNYDFVNQWGRIVWAKMITAEFNEKMGKKIKDKTIKEKSSGELECEIVKKYVTEAFIQKEKAKLVNDNGGEWSKKMISHLIQVVWHSFIEEEIWEIIKKYKNPIINFGDLNSEVIKKIKEVVLETPKDVN